MSKLKSTGVTPEINPRFAKRIILTNILGLLFAFNMAISGFAFIYFSLYKLSLFTFGFVGTELFWLVLNYYKYYNLSRLGMLISSNVLGFTVSVLLPDTGYNHGFFVMSGLSLLLFDLKERKSLLLGLMLPVVLYPLSEWFQYQLTPEMTGIVLSDTIRTTVSYGTGMFYIGLIYLMFLFLSRENNRAEEELENQRARAFSSAKFAALGEMAGGISHEINNPMTIINLSADKLKLILSDDVIDKEQAFEAINVISKTIKRVDKTVESMKNFSRQGEHDEMQPEHLQKIIEDVLSFCSERLSNHHIKLMVEVPKEAIFINCQYVQISQVLLNLLNNAFDAVESCPEKWIKVAISRNTITKKLILSIADSGEGILPIHKNKIFSPFFTTKPLGKGTGLGLSLSKKMIEDHGGALVLNTDTPHTQFDLELPY